jgi:hypothetical protein
MKPTAEKQINKNKEESPMKTKSVHVQRKEDDLQEIKLFHCYNTCLVKQL